jgi:hypothetical protein
VTDHEKEEFKGTFHGHALCALRDLIMKAPESSDRTKALGHLKDVFDSSFGLWLLWRQCESNNRIK